MNIQHIRILLYLLAFHLFFACGNSSSCDVDSTIILDKFYRELQSKRHYMDLFTKSATLLITENLVNTIIDKEIENRSTNSSIVALCKNTNHVNFFKECSPISVHKINPDLASNHEILEFSPLYFDSISEEFLIVLTYHCGNDCGFIELFILKESGLRNVIKEEIEIGVM